ncbi:MAG: hypothetical protein KDA90_21190 [Planctomycetaceae bacterium]|nr:hypothetical protein [Planctomycetaceae bacterium]
MTCCLLAVGSNAALVTFLVYTAAVFVIAWAANRMLTGKAFLSEYFLGSRSLGMWAFALTFAATSASGGTFTGFPAKIYSHGWILALWIASYMVVPICTMGFVGKRINQLARRCGAITVPDLLRDRFGSPAFGLIATALLVFFMAFNLVAQFKAGSTILKTLILDVPLYGWCVHQLQVFGQQHADSVWMAFLGPHAVVDWGYLMCLVLFGVAVIAYTTYGGFRAVVWTDVMQGVVMVIGVLIMLPLALSQVGGLSNATRQLAKMTPPRIVSLDLRWEQPASEEYRLPRETWLKSGDQPPRIFWTTEGIIVPAGAVEMADVKGMEVTSTDECQRVQQQMEFDSAEVAAARVVEEYQYGMAKNQGGSYVTGPGPMRGDADGFLPLGVAVSFFFMWAISGTGQPQYMVRLMAFKDARTLRRAIMTVTLYFGVIYFPLVIIFCCARVMLPGLDHDPDSIMPRMAVHLTTNVGHGWLAGLLIAAPFAAVMSTVDSFLLVVSSSLVRDVWQRNIDPDASEKTIKRMSYWTTLVIGLIALLGAVNPPRFLQDIIVYVGSGLAAAFLVPVVAALYWPRSNSVGCIAGMLGGFGAHLGMHIWGMLLPGGKFVEPYLLFGLSPVLIGLTSSLVATILLTLATRPPSEDLVRRFFARPGAPVA